LVSRMLGCAGVDMMSASLDQRKCRGRINGGGVGSNSGRERCGN